MELCVIYIRLIYPRDCKRNVYNIPKRYRSPRARKLNKGRRKEEENPVLVNSKKVERSREALLKKTEK